MGQHFRKIWYVFVRVTRTQSEASAENICNCVSVAWSSATQFDIVTSCGQFGCCSLRGWRSYAKLLGVTYLNAANRLQFSREETFWGYLKCAMRNELNSAFFLSEFFVHACWFLKELNFFFWSFTKMITIPVCCSGYERPAHPCYNAGFYDRWDQEEWFQNFFSP